MKVTIAKGLKLKNRLAERLASVTNEITANNSVMKGKDRKIDVLTQVKVRKELSKAIVGIKLAIHKANLSSDIQFRILTNAELKGAIAFYKGLNTEEGITAQHVRWGQDEKIIEYDAAIKYADVQETVLKLERIMDENQDAIDGFNHNTIIEIPDNVNELIK